MRRENFLSGLALDRLVELRTDPERLETVWRQPESRVLPVWRSRHLVLPATPPEAPEILFVRTETLEEYRNESVLLGAHEEIHYFAIDVSQVEEPIQRLGLDPVAATLGLREVAPLLPQSQGALLAYANGILSWHRRHRFCGNCGSETRPTQGGHVRQCENDACQALHFPRTDPAIIVLVTDRDECLLGRQAAWPKGVYSTLAGFVEPGESLEEAVRREVREETSVDLGDVLYHSSQPWPFPSSLMVGFTAHAKTRAIRVQPEEIEDARWFTREELRTRTGVELPSAISIARRLIEDWLGDEG